MATWPANEKMTLKKLSQKVAPLLAIITAQCFQPLKSIKINTFKTKESKITIFITDILKNLVVLKELPTLEIPIYDVQSFICPARALKAYLNLTKESSPKMKTSYS